MSPLDTTVEASSSIDASAVAEPNEEYFIGVAVDAQPRRARGPARGRSRQGGRRRGRAARAPAARRLRQPLRARGGARRDALPGAGRSRVRAGLRFSFPSRGPDAARVRRARTRICAAKPPDPGRGGGRHDGGPRRGDADPGAASAARAAVRLVDLAQKKLDAQARQGQEPARAPPDVARASSAIPRHGDDERAARPRRRARRPDPDPPDRAGGPARGAQGERPMSVAPGEALVELSGAWARLTAPARWRCPCSTAWSFLIRVGDYVAIMGRWGSGKSTLIAIRRN